MAQGPVTEQQIADARETVPFAIKYFSKILPISIGIVLCIIAGYVILVSFGKLPSQNMVDVLFFAFFFILFLLALEFAMLFGIILMPMMLGIDKISWEVWEYLDLRTHHFIIFLVAIFAYLMGKPLLTVIIFILQSFLIILVRKLRNRL